MDFSWRVEQLESNIGIHNIIILVWTKSLSPAYFSYLINIVPETSYTFTEMRITINVLPNVTYNVSVIATPLCGPAEQNSPVTPVVHIGLSVYCK